MNKAVEYTVTHTIETARTALIDEDHFLATMNIPLDPATCTGEVIEIFLERTGLDSTSSRSVDRRRTAEKAVRIVDAIGGTQP